MRVVWPKEMVLRGARFQQQVQLPVHHEGEKPDKEFVVDLVVEDEPVLELKAIEVIAPMHETQLLSYLRLANKRLGC